MTSPYIDENYWNIFFKKADEIPEPDHLPWIGLSNFLLENKQTEKQLESKLDEELKTETAYHNTHPSLTDRLNALQVKAELSEPAQQTAADLWLGDKLNKVIEDYDKDWLEVNKPKWVERYEYVRDSRKTLSDLSAKQESELTDDELWQKEILTEEFLSEDEAYPVYQSYQQRHPDDPDVAYSLGSILYSRDDPSLLEQMKIALDRQSLIVNACEYAYYYLCANEKYEEAEWWKIKAEEQIAIDAEDDAERAEFRIKDTLVKVTLDKEVLDYIRQKLEDNPDVKKAWIVEKKVKHYPHLHAIAIAVEFRIMWTYKKALERVIDDIDYNCTLFVVPKYGEHRNIARAIMRAGDRIV